MESVKHLDRAWSPDGRKTDRITAFRADFNTLDEEQSRAALDSSCLDAALFSFLSIFITRFGEKGKQVFGKHHKVSSHEDEENILTVWVGRHVFTL